MISEEAPMLGTQLLVRLQQTDTETQPSEASNNDRAVGVITDCATATTAAANKYMTQQQQQGEQQQHESLLLVLAAQLARGNAMDHSKNLRQRHCCCSHRIFLQGPAQSGKTSFLLEAAVDLVKLSFDLSCCACQNQSQSYNARATSFIHSSKTAMTCQCATPVVILKRQTHETSASTASTTLSSTDMESENDQEHPEEFPFFVRPRKSRTTQQTLQSIREDPSVDSPPSHVDNDNNNDIDGEADPQQSLDWDAHHLQRIRIWRYQNLTDILYYLWTLQGLPPSQRPCKGIFIDDLRSTDPTAMVNQILAVLADTADFLGPSVFAVAALATEYNAMTSPTQPHLRSGSMPLVQHFLPTSLTLVPPMWTSTSASSERERSAGCGKILTPSAGVVAEYHFTNDHSIYEWTRC